VEIREEIRGINIRVIRDIPISELGLTA